MEPVEILFAAIVEGVKIFTRIVAVEIVFVLIISKRPVGAEMY